MIEDELLIEGVRAAAAAAGTVGATARMVSDELRMDPGDVVHGLDRLERADRLIGDTPAGSARWYGKPERVFEGQTDEDEAMRFGYPKEVLG